MSTVLVVDDEPQIAEIARDYLRLAGFEVIVAGDGVRAVLRRSERRLIEQDADGDPEDLPRLFERFQKGSHSGGSGLGLAIARKLVLAHGGDIGIESVAGEGTVVTLTLPR